MFQCSDFRGKVVEQHRFIGFDGAYCTAGAKALGVSDVSIENGQYAPIAVLGTLLVYLNY